MTAKTATLYRSVLNIYLYAERANNLLLNERLNFKLSDLMAFMSMSLMLREFLLSFAKNSEHAYMLT